MTAPTVIYISSLEPESGKSLVSFGAMEAAAAQTSSVGYFRPVIAAGPDRDPVIELMRSRFRLAQTYEESFGVTTDETRGLGETVEPALVHRILTAFDELATHCDVVVVEGTDFTGASAAFEFALNSEVAAHLGAACVVVARAHSHRPDQLAGVLAAVTSSLAERHVPIIGYIVNRVPPAEMTEFRSAMGSRSEPPVWFLPEEPALGHLTMGDVARALDARVLSGDAEAMARDIHHVTVAAMTLPHLMARLQPHELLVLPGDRADVILMAQAARFSAGFPPIAGLLLTGGYEPDPAVAAFTAGLGEASLPILLTQSGTYETVDTVSRTRGSLESGDERRLATGLRLFEDHVDIDDLIARVLGTRSQTLTPVMFERRLVARAREDRRHIVLPEGEDDRILVAADRLMRRDVARLTVLGDRQDITSRSHSLGLDLDGVEIRDPRTDPQRDTFADEILAARRARGMSADTAHDLAADPSWFGTLMVHTGAADGMVSGAAHTTADTVRPALQIIRTAPGTSVVSSVFLMAMPDRVLVYGDCAVVPDPTAEQLADIALSSAATAESFGVDPFVAMLSYSTGSSGSGADVLKVSQATQMVRERAPELPVEGPIQFDAAVDPSVAAKKLPGSAVAGRATVLIFPDLNTGNNTYKAVQRSAGAVAIGPILQGLRLPVNDLSRGATVDDIVNTVVITAIQAQTARSDS
ncbi:MAG: phosphate acetyltransferase [Candidatus Nanopelagicales bacterium]